VLLRKQSEAFSDDDDLDRVGFWQGDPERRHQRLLYARSETGWSKSLLWP
jgi:pyridoxine/pyridoxamine 5'-phosphate oxidase